MYKPRTLDWDDSLTTGDQELDTQHRHLLDMFNDLGKAIEESHGGDEIERILGRMNFYAGWHFGREDDCMEKFRCPTATQNSKAHAVFIEKLNKYRADFEKLTGSKESLALKIHEDLSDWIVNHVMIVDGALYMCIHNKPKSIKS